MAMGAPEPPRLDQDPLLLGFLAVVVVPALIMAGYWVALARPPYYEEPHYSVVIDSASGVGPVCSGGRRVVDPEFNLTFRLDSRGLSLPGCADRGMHLEVSSYRGALLASTIATSPPRSPSASMGGRRWTGPLSRGQPAWWSQIPWPVAS
jgi:hypothetical protein